MTSQIADPKVGVVLSGGGSRAAYQVGALRALSEELELRGSNVSVVVGTSLGGLNGLVFAAGLRLDVKKSVELLRSVWARRTFKNTFQGSMSRSFLRSLQIAFLRYHAPGPTPSSISIFDPSPLRTEIDLVLQEVGPLSAADLPDELLAVAVVATVEGAKRKPLLLAASRRKIQPETLQGAWFEAVELPELTAAHGLASAALPSVLPSVALDLDSSQVRLIDGGICDNIPVDPAVRLGADVVFMVDSSGRRWWFDRASKPHYTRPSWEIPAGESTYCMRPQRMVECMNRAPFGPLLKAAVGRSTSDFITALGPTWPIFKILKHKLGEELAYEVMSYAALHPDFMAALDEQGYREARAVLEKTPLLPQSSPQPTMLLEQLR